MTPKQKAEELVKIFEEHLRVNTTLLDDPNDVAIPARMWATIVCNTVIETLLASDDGVKTKWQKMFYNEVRKEIGRL